MFSYHPGPKVVLVVSHCLCFRYFNVQIVIGIIHGFTYFVFANFFIETFCCKEVPTTLRNILCNETALWGKDVKGLATFDDSSVDHAHLCPWEWRKFAPRSGARGNDSPGAESLWGRRITAEGAESPNNVTRTVLNTVHLLPKNFICEHGGGKLVSCPWRHLTSLRPCSPVNRSSCAQNYPAPRWA